MFLRSVDGGRATRVAGAPAGGILIRRRGRVDGCDVTVWRDLHSNEFPEIPTDGNEKISPEGSNGGIIVCGETMLLYRFSVVVKPVILRGYLRYYGCPIKTLLRLYRLE